MFLLTYFNSKLATNNNAFHSFLHFAFKLLLFWNFHFSFIFFTSCRLFANSQLSAFLLLLYVYFDYCSVVKWSKQSDKKNSFLKRQEKGAHLGSTSNDLVIISTHKFSTLHITYSNNSTARKAKSERRMKN